MADKASHTIKREWEGAPGCTMVECECGWTGPKDGHGTHRADSRPHTSLPSDTIEALGGVQYHAAWLVTTLAEVQASAAPLELPQRITDRVDDLRRELQKFNDVRDGRGDDPFGVREHVGPMIESMQAFTWPGAKPGVHDLSVRTIAHEVARQHPENDDAAEAFARQSAVALGLKGMPFTRAVEAAMQAWRETYADGEMIGIAEAHEIPHADLYVAARAVLIGTGDTALAGLYMMMALYGALSERP